MVTKIEAAKTAIVLLAKDAIKAGQDVIRKNLVDLDKLVHENAVQCMLHAETHGDTSLMRRLLVEVIDTKTGYRRQGLINWMRKFSPMELSGDNINLTGKDELGNKRPFRVEEANATPFWSDKDNDEKVAKPVYQQTLMSGITRAIKDFRNAAANTNEDGTPIDVSKPFYDGKDIQAVSKAFDAMEAQLNELPSDNTREVRQAQQKLEAALAA